MAEDTRHCRHISPACDHQAGSGVPEGVDVQIFRQTVLFENQLEAVSERGWRHGQRRTLPPEQEVIAGQFPSVIVFGDVLTFMLIFPQKAFHLSGEVDIAVTGAGLWRFYENFLVRHLDGVAADVDGMLFPIDVAPLECTAFSPPHSRSDDAFEISLIFNALVFQRGNDFLRRFRIRNFLFSFPTSVAISAPCRIMRKKATLHGIREDTAQRSVYALNGVLGEWLFRVKADDLLQLCVKAAEVFRP